MEIKDLQLTENDFKLLIDGLDALPEKGAAGELMFDLISGVIEHRDRKMDRNEYDNIKRKEEYKRAQKEKGKEGLKEEIKILQGKLLMFKRYLIETNALKQVNDMLK